MLKVSGKEIELMMGKPACLANLPAPPQGKSGWPWSEEAPRLSSMMPDGKPWPRVSIVTPSFNQGIYLEETIRSVLLQSYPNFEYWVMDGGSSDHSVEIIRLYEPWLTGWVSEKDGGQADAINKGWSRSTGDFLGWINSDDMLLKGAIPDCIQFFNDHPEIGFVYGNLQLVDSSGNFLGVQTYDEFDLLKIIRDCNWISQPGNLIRRSVLTQIGFLDPNLHFIMDFDLWIRAGFVTKLGYLRQPLARFRKHVDAKTSIKMYIAAQEIKTIYDRVYSRTGLPAELLNIRKRAYGSSALYSALAFYASNLLNDSFEQLIASTRLYPYVLFSRRFWSLGAKVIFASLVGGTKSPLYLKIRDFWTALGEGRHK